MVTQASIFTRASGVLHALIGTIKLAKKVILSDGLAPPNATKEQVDAQTWPTTLADLKIQAAKEGLGIPLDLPLRNIARPCRGTKVFTWGLRAVNGEHDVGIVHSDKRWRIAPSPMVAWCGAHTHGVNEAWSTLWAKVRNLADDGGGRDEIADE